MENRLDETVFLGHLFTAERRYFSCEATDPADAEAWARDARPALRDLIGLSRIADECDGFTPWAELCPGSEDCGPYNRQRGILHSEPGAHIPFIMLRPQGSGPFPIGLFPHGHEQFGMETYCGLASTPETAAKILREDRDVAVQAVRRGMLAVAPTTRGFFPAAVPDATNRHDGRHCRCQALHAFLAGRTAIGERVWDMMRLLDWLAALPETDAGRILVMGNSGGGMVTTYTAACDERVSVGVPSCSFCSLAGVDGALHHCDCNAVPGILRWGEFWDVAGLVAPRHLLVVNGAQDPLFPVAEVDRAVAGVRRIFASAGVPTHFEHRYGDGGHRFYKALMWPWIESVLRLPDPDAAP